MKTLRNILALTMLVAFVLACKNDAKPEVKTVETETTEVKELNPDATYAKAEFTVEGMTCAIGCAATIEKKIAKMDGVKSAKVDFDKKLAMVEYDVEKVNPDLLIETVKKTGDTYSVKDMKTVEEFEADEISPDDKKVEQAKSGKETACKADCKMACCLKEAKA
jgi:Cu+-exporting ATPase